MPPHAAFTPPPRPPIFPILALLLALLEPHPVPAAEPARLKILTTIAPLYSWTTQIAGDHADVENLLPRDVGPHNFSFRPRDLRKLQEADLVILNGLGLEDWLERAVRNTGGAQRLVRTADGLEAEWIRDLPTLRLDPGSRTRSRHAHAHDENDPNPHVWLDPLLARHGVTNILRAMVRADPTHAAAYQTNAARYIARLDALHADLVAALNDLPRRAIVTYHDAFPYFIRRYGLEWVGVVEEIPSVDPTPRYLAELLKVIRARDVRVIFTEPQFNPRLARRLQQDLGVAVAELDVLESGPLSPDAYEQGMRANLETLVRHLR